MFCDLVGSTALSARLDPEDMRDVIAAYHKCCASLIERDGGFVAKYMGDGVLPISAIRRRTRTTPSGRCGRARDRRGRAEPVTAAGAPLQCASASRPGSWWWATCSVPGRRGARRRRRHAEPRRAAARDRRPDSVVIAEGTRKLLGGLFELRTLARRTSRASPGGREPCGAAGESRRAASRRCTLAD